MSSRILSNVMALGAGQLVTMACGIVTAIILARTLGPSAYGVLGFGTALLSYFGLLVNMGMDVHGVREISHQPTHGFRLVKMIVGTRIVLALLLFAILVLALPYFGWSEKVRSVLLIQGIGLFGVALTVDFYFQAEQRMGIVAIRQGGAAIAGVLAVVSLVRDPGDLNIAAAIPVTVLIISGAALLARFWSTTDRSNQPEESISRRSFLQRSIPVALMGVLATIPLNLDIVFLGYMVNEIETGKYTAASRIVMMSLVVPSLVISGFLPAMSVARKNDADSLQAARLYARTIGYLGGAAGGFGILTAPAIISLFFGEAFAGASSALMILMANVTIFYLATAFTTPLLAWQSDKANLIVFAFGAGLNIVLNLILIPLYGIEGAAAATLISQISMALSLMAVAHKAFNLRYYRLMARILTVTVLSLVPIYAASQFWDLASKLPSLGVLIVMGCSYLAIYVLLSSVAGVATTADLRNLLEKSA